MKDAYAFFILVLSQDKSLEDGFEMLGDTKIDSSANWF